MLICRGSGLLQVERSGENPVGHGEGGEQTHDEEEGSAGLGQWKEVGHRVTAAGRNKHPEVQQCRTELGPGEGVEKANHQEGNDILQVIQMASEGRERRG